MRGHVKQRWLSAIVVLAGFIACGSAWAASDATAEMKALLEQGRSADAYELGRQQQDQLGEPLFDFYYGVAAANSGRAGEGVLALERYVANMPEDAQGRLELARAYFVLGEDARAREEFLLVLDANPPADVRANVDRFLDALRSRESLYRTATGFHLEAGIGYDNNINAGVSAGTTFRLFGVDLLVPDAALERRGWFASFTAAFNRSIPVRPGLILFGSAAAEMRKHDAASEFDQASVRFDGGATYIEARNVWRASLSYSNLWLESDRYRQSWTLTGEWQRQLDELSAINAFLQLSQLRYEGANALRDSTFPVLGFGYRRAFISTMQPLVNAIVFVGKEDVRSDVRSDLSREIYGVRLTGSFTPAPRWSVLVGATWQESDYRGPDLVRALDFERKDRFAIFDAAVAYAIDKNWSVRLEGLISESASNDTLFDYRRNAIVFKVRYEDK